MPRISRNRRRLDRRVPISCKSSSQSRPESLGRNRAARSPAWRNTCKHCNLAIDFQCLQLNTKERREANALVIDEHRVLHLFLILPALLLIRQHIGSEHEFEQRACAFNLQELKSIDESPIVWTDSIERCDTSMNSVSRTSSTRISCNASEPSTRNCKRCLR